MTDNLEPDDAEARTGVTLDFLDGCADKWAADTNLFAMIHNVVSPMRLTSPAPVDVRESFIRRMEQQIDALIRLAFVEGACHAHFGWHESQDK